MTTLDTTKAVLNGVPRIGFDIHLCPFPGSLFSYLKYTGTPAEYDFLMGSSGAAFRRLFNRDDGGNVDLSYFQARPYQQVFAALGYRWHFVPAVKQDMIDGIRQQIDQGKPIIAFGIIGPPEAGLITGYAADGEVLYGWNYFQQGRDQYYEKAHWFETQESIPWQGLVVIDEPLPQQPTDRATLIASLKWALELAETSQWAHLPNHSSGLAAYDAWAHALEVDADYPVNDAKVMDWRCMVYGDQCTMLEERKTAAGYLRLMAKRVPEVAQLLIEAAESYQRTGEYVSKLWPWGFTSMQDARAGLDHAATRRELAQWVRVAKAEEATGVAHLKTTLAKLGA